MDNQSVFLLMLPAFFECVVLFGIFSYLGIHVIKRKVIFVDLAFAQIAALGILIAFLFGIPPHTKESFVFGMGLTAIGATVITLSRFRESKIPQEAIIGLIYAIAAAIAILLVDKAPHGAEHIKEILTGSILWVKWEKIGATAAVYALVGLFHYIFRDKFLLISNDPEKAWASGINVRFWDFLFYVSFGLVITMSVDTAGILIVFVFLVAPAIIAIILTDRMLYQLLIGWGLGVVVTILGLFVAYVVDLPTGPAVIGAYAIAIIVIAGILYNIRSSHRVIALRNTIIVTVLFAAAFALMFPSAYLMRSYLGEHTHEHGAHKEFPSHTEQIEAEKPVQSELEKMVALFERSVEEGQEKMAEIQDIQFILGLFVQVVDPEAKSVIVNHALELDKKIGASLVLDYLREDPPLFYRQNVLLKLNEISEKSFEFDVSQPFLSETNQKAAQQLIEEYNLD
jgi:zinc/manganese transport system permease protein